MDVAAKMPLAQSASQRARGSERGKRCGSYATLGCGRPQRVRRQNAYATLCANSMMLSIILRPIHGRGATGHLSGTFAVVRISLDGL